MSTEIKRTLSVAVGVLLAALVILIIWSINSDNKKFEESNEKAREICQKYGYDSAGCTLGTNR
ncbi:Uncharacterised protein (plasmid) [Tsukamurella tyrosinosolvens]|uniref:Uncharacterized protein n=1 Tax=Tsukamurella tyrosinosolvens TaxID=57704 RepID=A0A1H4QQV0_TSUTY|nr:hypothetical protein [Tsukamurella tyrosinosolvens]SEC21891.1 hypothetical protein SAMN04489793_1818 [Tsukamurella tyrosinosolvens]VEH92511.1 Uncharacterised protein [Tsukamurella tyrosinosolvens]